MTTRTISEALFERFCTETDIPFTCLSPDPSIGRRTPDYEVYWQNPPVLVEVKQIDPNRDDKALRSLIADTGEYISRDVPGHRLRGRISKAGRNFEPVPNWTSPRWLSSSKMLAFFAASLTSMRSCPRCTGCTKSILLPAVDQVPEFCRSPVVLVEVVA